MNRSEYSNEGLEQLKAQREDKLALRLVGTEPYIIRKISQVTEAAFVFQVEYEFSDINSQPYLVTYGDGLINITGIGGHTELVSDFSIAQEAENRTGLNTQWTNNFVPYHNGYLNLAQVDPKASYSCHEKSRFQTIDQNLRL